MITCIIVDDEQHAIDLLSFHINQTPFLQLVATTTSPVQALELVREHQVDLIFLDVQMPQMSGIEFMQLLNRKSEVILTTAYSEYAMEGFENEVVDYLLKPISFPRFMKAAQRARSRIKPAVAPSEENDYLLIKTEHKGKLLKININDIVHIEGMKNYVCFYTQQGDKIMALLNIKDLEERLPADQFIRTHKSFILSISHITMIEGNTIYVDIPNRSVPIGETYRETFMAQMKGKIMTNKM